MTVQVKAKMERTRKAVSISTETSKAGMRVTIPGGNLRQCLQLERLAGEVNLQSRTVPDTAKCVTGFTCAR